MVSTETATLGASRRALCWCLGAALVLVPAAMLGLLYALGPVGTCEADLNDTAMFLVWLAATATEGVLALMLWLLGASRILPRRGWRYALALPVGLGAAAAIFLLGLIPLLTYTTCAD